ncbi:DUF2585 domain-containing protein [Sphingomonas sp. AOB5]|uniref:DUF2585 domain-containing protein n=1 Tax=Sphingomonas sp. AOB5 TaxID=3034017 RepID=UPI0023F7EF7A|nr:DUF2585 domain-containing protein [Sphingomonas sp. AOB5]MDF7777535.1 DUF2585 domain-containing protein [Sphingomonas sp. AOB5]
MYAALALAAGFAITLVLMDRPPICTCGTIKLWHGAVHSSENSQHLADWYTFSHIIHGFLFYAAAHFWLKGDTRRWAFPAAILVEGAWEVLENSPIIINRYREATIALGYSGDSIVNSMADIGWMSFGFWLATRLPARVIIGIAIAFELMTLLLIRDNLTLNVLMLVWPIDAIKVWQGGAWLT